MAAQEVTSMRRICDVCGDYGDIWPCPICEGDFCIRHRTTVRVRNIPDNICDRCWELGRAMREQIFDAHDAADKRVYQILADWRTLVKCEDTTSNAAV